MLLVLVLVSVLEMFVFLTSLVLVSAVFGARSVQNQGTLESNEGTYFGMKGGSESPSFTDTDTMG